jgi:hypothetical protein
MGLALGVAMTLLWPAMSGVDDANTKEVGVEWVNNYHGWAPTLAACDDDAVGFYNALGSKGWTKVYNWGDDNAWEEDFKSPEKPGGGNDANYADNVDFVYFSGHGNSSGFYQGIAHDDTCVAKTDAVWGDKDLEWIALSACQVLNNGDGGVFGRWGWPVFKGLHLILGMHTSMSDTPDQGTYFVRYMTGDLNYPSYGAKLTIVQAWRQAAWWSLPSAQYCAILGAVGPGGDTWYDYLPGYGSQVADPNPPTSLWYVKYACG